jgi:hypothetical protein
MVESILDIDERIRLQQKILPQNSNNDRTKNTLVLWAKGIAGNQ